jgi:HSP20 family protein
MKSLSTTLERAVNSLFSYDDTNLYTKSPEYILPTVDIEESDDKYVVKADLPGVDKKNIAVSAENGVLTITAEKENDKTENTKGYKYYERYTGTFKRSFKLTEGLDSESISASFKNGVLTVDIPKKEKNIARKIEIK